MQRFYGYKISHTPAEVKKNLFHKQNLGLNNGERLYISCIAVALVWTLFYGLIIKVTFSNSALFSFKTYVPEVLLCIALIFGDVSGISRGVSKEGLVLFCLLGTVFCLGIAFDNRVNAAVVLRDVYMPIGFLFLMSSAKLSFQAGDLILRMLSFIMKVYLVVAVTMYLVEAINGYEWTARFYTGYAFWGQDPVSKIEINSNGTAMRLPGPSGSSVKCSLYALGAFVVFLANDKMRNWTRACYAMLAIVCILLYNGRSSLFTAIVIFLYFISNNYVKGRWSGFAIGLITFATASVVLLALSGDTGALNTASALQRISLWVGMLTDQDVITNLFFPTNVFSASSGGGGIAGLSLTTDWDNAYLYIAFAFGLLTAVLLIACFFGYWKKLRHLSGIYPQRSELISLCRYLLLATAVLALATNIFQGRSWFFFFVVIFGSVYPSVSNLGRQQGVPCFSKISEKDFGDCK